jgi:hypothetical protein
MGHIAIDAQYLPHFPSRAGEDAEDRESH